MGKSKEKMLTPEAEEKTETILGEGKEGDEVKKASFWDQILLNRGYRAIAGILFFGILLPSLVFIYMYATEFSVSGRSCAVYDDYRVECMPGLSPTANQCRDVGCCWNKTSVPHCYHSLPSYHNYRRPDSSEDLNVFLEPLSKTSSLGTPAHPISLNIYPMSKKHLTLLFSDKSRYEGDVPDYGIKIQETDFVVRTYGSPNGKPPFSFEVFTDISNEPVPLISTAEGPFVASDKYWVISLKLPSSNVYGWGGAGVEGLGPPTLRLSKGPLPQWAGGGRRLAHPFLLCLKDNGNTFGILIMAAGPLEADLLPSGLLTIRAVTTVWMEMHILAGPKPADVLSQLCEAVGKPSLPPYWALGLHVCRNDSSDAKKFFSDAKKAGLPFDSDCLGLRALGKRAFDMDPMLINDVKLLQSELTKNNRKFLHVQFPQIEYWNYPAFNEGKESGVFVKYGDENDALYLGTLNGLAVVFPSLVHPKTQDWLTGILTRIQADFGPIDGIVIEDDSPYSNGTFGKEPHPVDVLPFVPRGLNGSISQGTLWWMSRHSDSILHYSMHNAYGYSFGKNLSTALHGMALPSATGKKPRILILGEWTQPGTGVFGGHGGAVRVSRTWTAMRSSFVSVLANGLVGIPLSAGIAACGRLNTVEESEEFKSEPFDSSLCRRWIRMGSLLPLWRIHLPPGELSEGMLKTLTSSANIRYGLLPYIYTQMYHASQTGTPVARHLLFEYPEMELARDADDQVLLGPALMVTPSFIPDAPTVRVFFPNGTWYSHPGGQKRLEVGKLVRYLLRRDETPMFVRGGHVIPMQKPGMTAPSSRGNPFTLLVAMDCKVNVSSPSNNSCATGDLFVDDGETLDTVSKKKYDLLSFTAPTRDSLLIKRLNSWLTCGGDPNYSTVIDSIYVYGADRKPNQVFVGGNLVKDVKVSFYDTGFLKIEKIAADWCSLPTGAKTLKINWV